MWSIFINVPCALENYVHFVVIYCSTQYVSIRSNLLIMLLKYFIYFWFVVCLFHQLMRKWGIKVSDCDWEFVSLFWFLQFCFIYLAWCFLQYWKFLSHYLVKYFFLPPQNWQTLCPASECSNCLYQNWQTLLEGKASINVRLTSLGFLFLLNSSNVQQIFKYIRSGFSSSHQKRIVKIT